MNLLFADGMGFVERNWLHAYEIMIPKVTFTENYESSMTFFNESFSVEMAKKISKSRNATVHVLSIPHRSIDDGTIEAIVYVDSVGFVSGLGIVPSVESADVLRGTGYEEIASAAEYLVADVNKRPKSFWRLYSVERTFRPGNLGRRS